MVQDAAAAVAAYSTAPLCHVTAGRYTQLSRAGEAGQCSQTVNRRVQPFKGTLRDVKQARERDCAALVEETKPHCCPGSHQVNRFQATESLCWDFDDCAIQCWPTSKQEIHMVYAWTLKLSPLQEKEEEISAVDNVV